MRPSVVDKRHTFRTLHESGCFVIPNPWNAGGARYLAGLGFKALATTSSGFAHAQGYADGAMPLDRVLIHLRDIADAVDLPVNADFEGGYASAPVDVAHHVRLCVDTGIAGLSIEDASGDPAKPLFDFDLAVARIRAARRAIDAAGGDVQLTARSEGFICGLPDLGETIRRLTAFAGAGADCVYAPGLATREQIAAVVTAVAPTPVNVLLTAAIRLTVPELADLGVRRLSTGGGLARVAWTAFAESAREILEAGTFSRFATALPNADLNALFRSRPAESRA
ncbi:MAG TPA: isocitrate lyase/phosphoenolpyruvate mutase family protein [Vicinamibacterales bacterium]